VSKKNIIRFGIKFIIIPLFLLTAICFALNEVIRVNITRQLRQAGPYTKIHVSSVHANIITSLVTLDSLTVDFPAYKKNHKSTHHVFIRKASLKGISFLQFALHKRLIADYLIVEGARLALDSLLLSKKDTLFHHIKLPVHKLNVRHIQWKNTAVAIGSNNDANKVVLKFPDVSLTGFIAETTPAMTLKAKKIAITSRVASNVVSFNGVLNVYDVAFNRSKYANGYHFKETDVQLSNISCVLPGRMHAVQIRNATLNSAKENIEIHEIQVSPMRDRKNFFRILGHQADMVTARISKVEVIKVNMPALLEKKLHAEKIIIQGGNVHVFRDRRYIRPLKNIPLPMEAFRAAPADVRVKIVELKPSVVEYEEQPKEGSLTGKLRVEKLTFSISPFINHFRAEDPAYIEMKTEGSLMGSGNVLTTMLLPANPAKPYRVEGVFKQVDLTRLNASSENLGKIRIKSGFLDFLYFQFTMSDEKSTGKIIGAYHRLIIQQLKKHTDEKKVAKIPSFVLRNVIIPLNKPASMPERKRTGSVHYKRDPSRLVSFYLLQSLLTGVKSSFNLGFLLPK
jgi:hypothetical protein